jgi:hypothetical protein
MNATTANQGNHCIFALNGDASRPPVDAGNQSLFVSSGTCADTGAGLSQRLPELIQLFVGELVK